MLTITGAATERYLSSLTQFSLFPRVMRRYPRRMRASNLSFLLCLLTAGSLFATDITPEEADKHVGEKVTVRGTVFKTVTLAQR